MHNNFYDTSICWGLSSVLFITPLVYIFSVLISEDVGGHDEISNPYYLWCIILYIYFFSYLRLLIGFSEINLFKPSLLSQLYVGSQEYSVIKVSKEILNHPSKEKCLPVFFYKSIGFSQSHPWNDLIPLFFFNIIFSLYTE